jgi:hypothetical protein
MEEINKIKFHIFNASAPTSAIERALCVSILVFMPL